MNEVQTILPSRNFKPIALCFRETGADVPGVTSVSVAGLLISPTDSKMKWAIKHHVIDLWNKAKVLKESWQRIIIFRAIIKVSISPAEKYYALRIIIIFYL